MLWQKFQLRKSSGTLCLLNPAPKGWIETFALIFLGEGFGFMLFDFTLDGTSFL
jgi:hypothetical protein